MVFIKRFDLRVNIYVFRIDVLFFFYGDKINFMCLFVWKIRKVLNIGVFVCLFIYRDVIVIIRKYCLKLMLKK